MTRKGDDYTTHIPKQKIDNYCLPFFSPLIFIKFPTPSLHGKCTCMHASAFDTKMAGMYEISFLRGLVNGKSALFFRQFPSKYKKDPSLTFS